MYVNVYEFHPTYFTWTFIFPLAALLFSGTLIYMAFIGKGGSGNLTFIRIVTIIFTLIFVPAFTMVPIFVIKNSYDLNNYYRSNETQVSVVEGVVSQFHPEPYGGHDKEHFYVNSVYFSYMHESSFGYNQTMPYGGFITHDGEKVRITYVNYYDNNVIMKLDIAK